MAKKKSDKRTFFDNVRDDHRARLARLSERRGVSQIKSLYDEAIAELERKLRKLGSAKDTFTAHQMRMLLAQAQDGQARIVRRMADGLSDATRDAQVDSLQSLLDDVHRLEKRFSGADVELPLDEAGRFRGVIDGRRQSLLRSHEESLSAYGGDVVMRIEDELSLSLATGESFAEAVERVQTVTETEWWKAERIVRTELMSASNSAQYDGMKALTEEIDDMFVRWEERVNDITYEPFDERVGADSIALHGQVIRPGEVFRFPNSMPDGTSIPPEAEAFIGESWAFPPNRPNDRATISPVRPSWGIPGWRWVNGRRVAWP